MAKKPISKAKLRGLLADPAVGPASGLLARMASGGGEWAMGEVGRPAVAQASGAVKRSSQAAAEAARFMGAVAPVVESMPNVGEDGSAPRRGLLGVKGAPTGRGLLSQAGNFADDFLFGGDYGRLRSERQSRDEGRAAAEAHRAAYAEAMGPNGFDPEAYGLGLAKRGQAPDLPGIGGLEGITDSQDVRGARGRTEQRGLIAGLTAPYARSSAGIPEGDLPVLTQILQSMGGTLPIPTTAAGVQAVQGAGMGADGYAKTGQQWAVLDENRRSNLAGEDYRRDALDFQKDDARNRLNFDRERFQADNAFRYDRAEAEDAYRVWQQNQFSRSDIEGMVLQKAIQGGVQSLTPEEKQVYDRAVAISQGGMGFGFGPTGMGQAAPPPGVGGQPAPAAAPAPRGGSGRSPQDPVRPQTDADYRALPVGAYFVDPDDGQVYRKGAQ